MNIHKNMKFLPVILISFFLLSNRIHAQTDTTNVLNESIYHLGEIILQENIDKEKVTGAEMQIYHTLDVSAALNTLPSVTLNNFGGRNEVTIYQRGFDIRGVPVFMDGIPVYIPYDGYLDLGRFTTYDLSKIDVSKGYTSISYGPNTMGGAINLVGIKPTELLELNAKLGYLTGDGFETSIGYGTNRGKYYIQTNFSWLERDFIKLSEDFEKSDLETDDERDHSYRKDLKGSLKIGYTPNNKDEYSLNYMYSSGSKGNPIYLGTDKSIKIRYWDWPYWDKQSVYFISNTQISEKMDIITRLYYDQFKNKLSSFDDKTYSTQNKPSSFNSYYDDYTLGGNVELTDNWNPDNQLKLSLHLKNDNHSEHNDNEPVRHFADNNFSLGLENIYNPGKGLTFIPGISYNYRKSLEAEDYDSKTGTVSDYPDNSNDHVNAQLASYYQYSENLGFGFNVAYRNRFATMKDRYSYRLGVAIPNPDLKSETALNFELSSSLKLANHFNASIELFYSRIDNTMQLVNNVQEDLAQMQNTGESEFYGTDLKLDYAPIDFLKLYAAYSYIHRENLSNPELLFTDVPDHKIFASAEYTFFKKLMLNIYGEYNSERINSTNGLRISPDYYLLNAKSSYIFTKYLKAEIGIGNIFDENYTIQEGYPEMGRNIWVSLYFNL